MKVCMVPDCPFHTRGGWLNKDADTVVKLYRFPAASKAHRRSEWCAALRVDPSKLFPRDTFVCSEHFPRGDSSATPIYGSRDRRGGFRAYLEELSRHGRTRSSTTSSRAGPSSSSSSSHYGTGEREGHSDAPSTSDHVNDDLEMPRYEDILEEQLGSALAQLDEMTSLKEGLQEELADAHQEIRFLESSTLSVRCLNDAVNGDEWLSFYTGLPDAATFNWILGALTGDGKIKLNYVGQMGTAPVTRSAVRGGNDHGLAAAPGPARTLTQADELLLTLARLRHGLSLQDLSFRFGVSTRYASVVFRTWIVALYQHLRTLPSFLTQKEVQRLMPDEFNNSPFKDTRLILDATEFYIDRASDLNAQKATWSQYKHANTFKMLVGISPVGDVAFLSDLYTGGISDVALTEKSGIVAKLSPGDAIMADRGFDIRHLAVPANVRVHVPAYAAGRTQLSRREVVDARRLSSVRIHVERAIGRAKVFRLINEVMPLDLAPIAQQIIHCCFLLTNFQKFLVLDVTDLHARTGR